MSDSHNLEILESIYQNSRMATESIDEIKKRCPDGHFKEVISRQQDKYLQDCQGLRHDIMKFGGKPKEPPKGASMMANMGISMKSSFDGSTQNLAKMMFEGTNMGIVDVTRVVNRANNADCAVVEKAKKLLNCEQQYANELKRFL